MTQQNIGVGTVANDGTGDPIRTAFTKTQNNFSEFYAAFSPTLASNNVALANNMTAGNSTVNAVANSTGLFFNGTFSQHTGTNVQIGNTTSTFFANSSGFWVGNSTVNVSTNSTHYFAGNSTVYAYGNSTSEVIANASGQTVITPISWTVGNSTANMSGNSITEAIANSTANNTLTPGSIVIQSPTANIAVGNSTVNYIFANATVFNVFNSNVAGHTAAFANGFINLIGGTKLIFGTLATVNTTAQVVTFNTATGGTFSVNVFTVFATSNNGATMVAVTTANSSTMTLVSNNATAQTAYWAALGI